MKPEWLIGSLAFLLALGACEKNESGTAGGTGARTRNTDASAKAKPQETVDTPSRSPGSAPASVADVPPPAVAPVAGTEYTAALALADEAEKEAALAALLKGMPPAEAANLAMATLPADAMRQRLLVTVVTDWAVAQPSATADWLSKAGDFPEKRQAIRITADLWQRLDFSGVTRWAATMPAGEDRQALLSPIAAHIRTQAQERWQDCLNSVNDPGLRADLERMLAPARD